jgi:hypothetical protein
MNWTFVRRLSGLLLLAASLVGLLWGLWPLPVQERNLVISPAEMLPVELPPGAAGELPPIAQPRLLFLQWPSVMRTGDLGLIRLVLGPAEQESAPPQASPLAGIAYSVLAEARLELPAIRHTPLGEVSQALLPGRPVSFVWDILPNLAGEMDGTVWLHLRFIPATGEQELRQVLTAQRLEIRVIDFLGLSGPWARSLGSAGVVVGAVLALDGAVIWLWQRLNRNPGV